MTPGGLAKQAEGCLAAAPEDIPFGRRWVEKHEESRPAAIKVATMAPADAPATPTK